MVPRCHRRGGADTGRDGGLKPPRGAHAGAASPCSLHGALWDMGCRRLPHLSTLFRFHVDALETEEGFGMEELFVGNPGTQALQPRKRGLVPGPGPDCTPSRGREATGANAIHLQGTEVTGNLPGFVGKSDSNRDKSSDLRRRWQLPGYGGSPRLGCSPVPQISPVTLYRDHFLEP